MGGDPVALETDVGMEDPITSGKLSQASEGWRTIGTLEYIGRR